MRCCSSTTNERERGVVAASAGNHALGLAYHGQLLGIGVTVVMPRFAPLIKVSTCRRLGARIILHGETYPEATRFAHDWPTRRARPISTASTIRPSSPGRDARAGNARASARRRGDRRADRRRRVDRRNRDGREEREA